MQINFKKLTNYFNIIIISLLFTFLIPNVYASESPVFTPSSLSVLTATPSGTISANSTYIFNDAAAFSGSTTYSIGNMLVPSSPQSSVTPSPSPAGITMFSSGSSLSGNFTVSSGANNPGPITSGASPLLVLSPSASPTPASSSADKASPCPPIGDINDDGVVTDADSQAVLQNIARLSPYQNLTADQIKRADVNGDDKISLADAVQILRYVAGLNSTFKACPVNVTPTPTPSPVARSVKITSPNGGETFKVGDKVRITWDSSKIDKVFLGYSFGPGSLNWIVTNIPNQGYYDWTVNIGNTTNTKVKIDITAYETGKGSIIDQSDDFFTVNPISDKASPCPPIGDINDDGVITEDDHLAARYIVALIAPYQNPTADQNKRADVNGDGRVMSSDSLRILRYIKGMDTTFPACVFSPAYASAQTVTAAPVTILSAPASPYLQLSSASATPITPTSTPSPSPSPTPAPIVSPSSSPTPSPTPMSSPSASATPSNSSGTVSLIPTQTSIPSPTATSSATISVRNNDINSDYSTVPITSGNTTSGLVTPLPSSRSASVAPAILTTQPSAVSSRPNILITGFNLVINGLMWGLQMIGMSSLKI